MKRILIIFFNIFFCLNSNYLRAQAVPYNTEFKVNTDTVQAYLPSVCGLTNGKYVVCWIRYDQNMNDDVIGRIFNNDGSGYGSEFSVNSYTLGGQTDPNISALSNGKFIVCWVSQEQDGNGNGIFGQIFNNNGTIYGSEFQVNTYINLNQQNASIATLMDGKFIICWESEGQDSSETGIFAQIFNEDGSKYKSEFQVNTIEKNAEAQPDISRLNDGKFVICWRGGVYEAGDGFEIYAQLFNNDGSKYGSEFHVNTNISDWQLSPSVSSLSDGKFIICWESTGYYGNEWSIRGQLFRADGSKYGDEFKINTGGQWDVPQSPVVNIINDQYFLVSWITHSYDGDGFGVIAQIFDNNGLKFGKEFTVNTTTASDQFFQAMGNLTDGKFVICWTHIYEYSDIALSAVYGKLFSKELFHGLQPFSIHIPENDATIGNTAYNFEWQAADVTENNWPWEQTKYTLYLDQNENFTSPAYVDSIFNSNYRLKNLIPGTTYFWKVLAKNIAGDSLWSNETFGFFVDRNATTSLEEISLNPPKEFKLYQNYPNPFNPSTTIEFEVAQPSHVLLKIFDIQGREVALLKDEDMQVGKRQVTFNAKNLASGVYFYSIQMGSYLETKKMLLLR